MSLWCGNCKQEIFKGFGLLYLLERTEDGQLRYPDRANDYVPANSSICDPCWSLLPEGEKRTDEDTKTTAENSRDTVFIYLHAESNNSPLWRSKTWSGIVLDESTITFIRPEIAARHLTGAVEIIERRKKSRESQ